MVLPFLRSPRQRGYLDTLNTGQVDIYVESDRALRSAIGKLARDRIKTSGRVIIGRDITLKSPIDINDLNGTMPPFEVTALGGVTIHADALDYVFGLRNSGMIFRNLRVRRTGAGYPTHFIKGVGNAATLSPLRIIDCNVQTKCLFDDGSHTIGNALIAGNYLSAPFQTAVSEYMIDINATGFCVIRDNFFSSFDSSIDPAHDGIRVTNSGARVIGNVLGGDLDVPGESYVAGNEFSATTVPSVITLSGERIRVVDNNANSGTLDINIDTDADMCSIRGNSLRGGDIAEVNSGASDCSIVGNTGVGAITTNVGGGRNTIIGNTGNGGAITITESSTDIINTGDSSGDYNQ